MREERVLSYVVVLVLMLFVAALALPPIVGNAAPAMAPTPVVFSNNGARSPGARLVPFFDGTPVAAMTPVSSCYDMRDYSVMDVEWTAAQSAALTVTLSHGNDSTRVVLGQTLINASSTPVATPAMQQYPLYGVQQCVKIQSANATPVSVWVSGLGK